MPLLLLSKSNPPRWASIWFFRLELQSAVSTFVPEKQSSTDGCFFLFRVMRPASVARWESGAAAAGGRRRQCPISAAVEKIEDKRKPDDFFGHRKAARRDNPEVVGSNPAPATIKPPFSSESGGFSYF